MTYDDWKTATPWDDEKEHECPVCDKPVDTPGPCCRACFEADMR